MSVSLLMDVHVHRAITTALRLRGADVLTAQEHASDELEDPDLLDRAALLGRVLFTQDADLLREATRRQRAGTEFTGVIYTHQLRVSIGQCVSALELIALAGEREEFANLVLYLPLK